MKSNSLFLTTNICQSRPISQKTKQIIHGIRVPLYIYMILLNKNHIGVIDTRSFFVIFTD